MKVLILFAVLGAAVANDWENLMENCDRNDDNNLDTHEFYCLFMQFDKDYDNYVTEAEFESGWKHEGIDYSARTPIFFMETDVTGDYKIGNDDMAYLKTIWDVNDDNYVTEAEFESGWKHEGIDYSARTPIFFMETDVTGDYKIGNDDMAYLKTIWDVNGDGRVSKKEVEAGWRAFYYDRFH